MSKDVNMRRPESSSSTLLRLSTLVALLLLFSLSAHEVAGSKSGGFLGGVFGGRGGDKQDDGAPYGARGRGEQYQQEAKQQQYQLQQQYQVQPQQYYPPQKQGPIAGGISSDEVADRAARWKDYVPYAPMTKRPKKHVILRQVIRVVTTVEEEKEDCTSKGGSACLSNDNCCYGNCTAGFCPTAKEIIDDNRREMEREAEEKAKKEAEEQAKKEEQSEEAAVVEPVGNETMEVNQNETDWSALRREERSGAETVEEQSGNVAETSGAEKLEEGAGMEDQSGNAAERSGAETLEEVSGLEEQSGNVAERSGAEKLEEGAGMEDQPRNAAESPGAETVEEEAGMEEQSRIGALETLETSSQSATLEEGSSTTIETMEESVSTMNWEEESTGAGGSTDRSMGMRTLAEELGDGYLEQNQSYVGQEEAPWSLEPNTETKNLEEGHEGAESSVEHQNARELEAEPMDVRRKLEEEPENVEEVGVTKGFTETWGRNFGEELTTSVRDLEEELKREEGKGVGMEGAEETDAGVGDFHSHDPPVDS